MEFMQDGLGAPIADVLPLKKASKFKHSVNILILFSFTINIRVIVLLKVSVLRF